MDERELEMEPEREQHKKVRVRTKIRTRKRVKKGDSATGSSSEESRSPSPRYSTPPSRATKPEEQKLVQQHSIQSEVPQIGVKSLQEARLAYLSKMDPSQLTAKENIELSRLRVLFAHSQPDPDARLPFRIITTSGSPRRMSPVNTTRADNYLSENIQQNLQQGYVNVRKTSGESPVSGVVFNVLYPSQLAGLYVPTKDGEETHLAITTDYEVAKDTARHEIIPEYKSEVKKLSHHSTAADQDHGSFTGAYAAIENLFDKSLNAPHIVQQTTEIFVNNKTREYSVREVVVEESSVSAALDQPSDIWNDLGRVNESQSFSIDQMKMPSEENPRVSVTETVRTTKRIDSDTEDIIDDLISNLQKSKHSITSQHHRGSSGKRADVSADHVAARQSPRTGSVGSEKSERCSGSYDKTSARSHQSPAHSAASGSPTQMISPPGAGGSPRQVVPPPGSGGSSGQVVPPQWTGGPSSQVIPPQGAGGSSRQIVPPQASAASTGGAVRPQMIAERSGAVSQPQVEEMGGYEYDYEDE